MKILTVNQTMTLSILMVIVLLLSAHTLSYADIVSVKPDTETSLIVTVEFTYIKSLLCSTTKTFLFQWRQKTPQGEWHSDERTFEVNWSSGLLCWYDNRRHTATRHFTIKHLIPGTTYEVRVNSGTIHEGTTNFRPLSILSAHRLEETNLDKSVVTLTLRYDDTYEADVAKIREAVSVSGITGVTIDTASVQRISDREITVGLNFDSTDFDISTVLIFSVDAGAIVDYTGDAFTGEKYVFAEKESVSASVVSPLTEATLDAGVVTLTLRYVTYDTDVAKIRDAVSVSGINGVTIDTATVKRISDTEVKVALDFDDTDFDEDADLSFSVAEGAIADYTGDAFTAEIPVTAHKESVSASVVSPLTEATLDAGVVTLTLRYVTYNTDVAKIRDAVSVSGINGVTIDTATVKRISDTEVKVALDFDDTDFDEDADLSFSVAEGAIADYTGDAFTSEIPVTAHKESVSASVVSPLTEATLDGSIVTLLLTGVVYEQDISKIREAVTVSGINGVSVDTATVQRISDRKVTVELSYDGTDFVQDTALTFSVASGAITNHKSTALTTEVPVTASRGEDLLAIFWTDFRTKKIQRANLDMGNLEVSNVEDLVTQELELPSGIALDVAGGKMYWTDSGTDKIQRANLDGSNVEDLVTGLRGPDGIALDVAGGKMYWTDTNTRFTDKIQRANLDGSNVEDLVTQGLWGLDGIALDVAGGKMYWTDGVTDKIQRANLDGSNVVDLVTQGLENPNGIALDVAGGKMYWTDTNTNRWVTDKIRRANLDGSNVEDLVTQGLENPRGIALDVAGGKMYWTDWDTDKIQCANLDGSNVQALVAGLNNPSGIAIVSSSLVNPTTETPIAKEDVNRDGVVDVQDLAYVGLQYGKTGTNAADINGDEIVNVDDFVLVAAAVDAAAAAAPAARAQVHSHFTAAQLQGWLTDARTSGNTSHTYQRGIAVIEGLLALLAPEATALLANYPNPFNPETWIPYQLSKPASVTLTIYDIQGHIVRALDLGHQRAGLYQTRSRAAYWDGRNAVGEPVASGIYFYTLTAGDFSATRKMLIRK